MSSKPIRAGTALAFVGFSLVASGAGTATVSHAAPASALSANATVYATGLNNPRGLKFGPDGSLYVAEGGTGGTASTVGTCTQVVPPPGPYTGSPTGGRISRIATDGTRTTVTDTLPSSQTSAALGGFISGVADVAFIGTTMYGLLAGAGCSHGVANTNNGIVRVNSDGTTTMVANLSAFIQSHAVAQPEADDFEPDGTWFNMAAVNGSLYALEPNHGELDKVDPTSGAITRVADISASQGHIVPTSLAYNGNFYVANLNTFPVSPGSSKIMQVTSSGVVSNVVGGLTAVTGLVVPDPATMYVLEMTTAPGGPTPNTGMILRVNPSGKREVIASGLNFPTGMTMGSDGQLYVSNNGIGAPGSGQIVRVQIPTTGTALPPTVTVNPTNAAPAGTNATISGFSFTPNSSIILSIRTTDNRLSAVWVQTDANGNFTTSTVLGPGSGLQTITAYDTAAGRSATTTITAESGTTPAGPAKLTLSATPGVPGKLATLTGTGFPASSSILLSWQWPDATATSGLVVTNSAGAFSVPFAISSGTHGCGVVNLMATSTSYPPRLLALNSGSTTTGC